MHTTDLTRELIRTKTTVNASVLAGDNYDALSQCVASGVIIRFMFPRLTSYWFKECVEVAGIPPYNWKVRTNSDRTRNLGADAVGGILPRYSYEVLTIQGEKIPSFFLVGRNRKDKPIRRQIVDSLANPANHGIHVRIDGANLKVGDFLAPGFLLGEG